MVLTVNNESPKYSMTTTTLPNQSPKATQRRNMKLKALVLAIFFFCCWCVASSLKRWPNLSAELYYSVWQRNKNSLSFEPSPMYTPPFKRRIHKRSAFDINSPHKKIAKHYFYLKTRGREGFYEPLTNESNFSNRSVAIFETANLDIGNEKEKREKRDFNNIKIKKKETDILQNNFSGIKDKKLQTKNNDSLPAEFQIKNNKNIEKRAKIMESRTENLISRTNHLQLIKVQLNSSHAYLPERRKRKRQYYIERMTAEAKAKSKNTAFHSRHAHKNLSRKQKNFEKSLLPLLSSYSPPFSSSSTFPFLNPSSSPPSFSSSSPFFSPLYPSDASAARQTQAQTEHLLFVQDSKLNISSSSLANISNKSPLYSSLSSLSSFFSSSPNLTSSSSSQSSPSSSLLSLSSVNGSSNVLSRASSEISKPRVNVVDENPSLDVGKYTSMFFLRHLTLFLSLHLCFYLLNVVVLFVLFKFVIFF